MSSLSAIFQDANPIWMKGVRARIRGPMLFSWAAVTLTLTAFVSLIIFLTITERDVGTVQEAAKAVLPGVIIIQAILLILFGTGAVALGVAQDRDEGLQDYLRMTPMSPTSKILGSLFGLPAREYALFLMTMPFVIVAAIVGRFDPLTLLHFYVVFFMSVWVYHMTALVAGMVTPKPRLAQMLSMGIVIALYFVLPNLSRAGITFFEFLTIRPTLFGLVYNELPASMRPPAEQSGIDSFRDVPFFGGVLHPTVYTLIVQAFVLAAMFSVAHRKWRRASCHLFSKAGGLLVFTGIGVFLLASVWAIIVSDDAYWHVFGRLERVTRRGTGQVIRIRDDVRAPETLMVLLMLTLGILGTAYILLIASLTSSRHTAIEGWRRAKKLGRKRLPWNSDEASSLPVAVVMLVLLIAGGAAVVVAASEGQSYFAGYPQAWSIAVLIVGLVGAGLFIQGLCERFSLRVFAVSLFLMWMIPAFAMMIIYAAFEEFELGTYVGLPCPPVLIGWSLAQMLDTAPPLTELLGRDSYFVPTEFGDSLGRIVTVGAVGYAAAGALVQVARVRSRAAIRRTGLSEGVA